MKKLLIIMCLASLTCTSLYGQSVESKRCRTCGKPLKECQYRGRHPQPTQQQNSDDSTAVTTPKVRMDGNDIVFVREGKTYRYKMILVESGTFNMGAKKTSRYGSEERDESPIHSVTVSSFYMGQTEVTQALWIAVMGKELVSKGRKVWNQKYGVKNPELVGRGPNYPAYGVSYNEAKKFISKLNSITGLNFRLPTEAEWEYAARGGRLSHGYRYSGSDTLDNVAWSNSNCANLKKPVAQKKANELGLYDMCGNVWEWCGDWYDSCYYKTSPQNNPNGPSTGVFRVVRGGGTRCPASCCRVSQRGGWYPDREYDSECGFRIVLSR